MSEKSNPAISRPQVNQSAARQTSDSRDLLTLPSNPTNESLSGEGSLFPKTSTDNVDVHHQIEFAKRVHEYLWNNILFAEQKAALVFASVAAFLGYAASGRFFGRMPALDVLWTQKNWLRRDWIILLFLALMVCSIVAVVRVVLPRVGGSPSGLLFWGAIASLPNASAYSVKVSSCGNHQILETLTSHNYELAVICHRKYKGVRLAMLFALAGFTAGFVSMMI